MRAATPLMAASGSRPQSGQDHVEHDVFDAGTDSVDGAPQELTVNSSSLPQLQLDTEPVRVAA